MSEKTTSPETEDLQAQIHSLKEDVANLTGMLRDMGERKVSAARESAVSRAQDALETSTQVLKEGREKAGRQAETLEAHITEKPLQATAIALGLGVALGWLSSRR